MKTSLIKLLSSRETTVPKDAIQETAFYLVREFPLLILILRISSIGSKYGFNRVGYNQSSMKLLIAAIQCDETRCTGSFNFFMNNGINYW